MKRLGASRKAPHKKTREEKEREEYIKKRYTAKRQTILVNLFAGAGAGKSTCASGVFSLLKHHNVNAELITEYAKDLVWEGRLHLNRNDMEIFSEQLRRQHRLRGKVDVMVTDSPILLSSIYIEPFDELFHATVMREFKKYNNFNFFIKRVKPYMKIGRAETKNGAKKIDDKVVEFLDREQVIYEKRLGDAETVNHITGLILGKLGIKQKYWIRRK
jgi:adenylylsulfate kinase-like enzyme